MSDQQTLNQEDAVIIRDYQKSLMTKRILLGALFIGVLIFIGAGTTVGIFNIPFSSIYRVIISTLLGKESGMPELTDHIIINIRLPRIILGLLAGCGLGVAGCVMQGILRNPMASPYTLGISSGASFGATLAIVLGITLLPGPYGLVANAFVGSLICSFIILSVSARRDASPVFMILTGIALMFLFSATTTLLQYFAEDDAVKRVVFWMVGSLGTADWMKIMIIGLVTLICTSVILLQSWELNLLSLGDKTALSLGVNVKRLRISVLILSVLMTASIVCFVGTIGFIGLVAPHICRMIIGGDNRYLIPMSGLLGGLLLASADLMAANVISPIEIPVGVITAYMGVPLFLFILMRKL